jgi:hypothetical protein
MQSLLKPSRSMLCLRKPPRLQHLHKDRAQGGPGSAPTAPLPLKSTSVQVNATGPCHQQDKRYWSDHCHISFNKQASTPLISMYARPVHSIPPRDTEASYLPTSIHYIAKVAGFACNLPPHQASITFTTLLPQGRRSSRVTSSSLTGLQSVASMESRHENLCERPILE